MNQVQQMRKRLLQNKKLGHSIDSGFSSQNQPNLQKNPLPQVQKSQDKMISPIPQAQQSIVKDKVHDKNNDKKEQPLKNRIFSQQKSIQRGQLVQNKSGILFYNKSTFQPNTKELKNVQLCVPKKAISLDEIEQIPKKTQQKNSAKILIKDVELLKQSLWNMQSALKGLENIKQKIKHNKKYRQKIKSKLHLLQQLF